MKSKSISAHDLSGKRYNFTDNLYITGGAAGKIYNVKGQPKLVAKIFKKKQSKNDSDRIREMVNDYKAGNVKLDLVWENNYKTKLGTWPIDILSDQRGNVIGYLMPKANGIELLEITENNFRKNPNYKSFSNTKNKFILCHRLAVVFSNFYKDGFYSNGDIKPQNIFIDIKGYPMILDLDNVTIKKKNKILKPKFVQFTPEYMAHDWNGDIYSDYFSIAVIFYELMFGIKPYVGSLKSGKLPRIKEKIDHRYFVHGRKKREFSVIPKPHDAFNTLPSNLQTLFHKAFDLDDKTKRPNMKEWSQAFYQYLINKKTITPTYQPNVKTTKKKRSTRKKKSTGTLFTPKTTSATVQKPSGKLSKKINYFKVPMAIRAPLLAGFIILAFMYITNQGSNLWDSSTDVKEDQSYQEFLKDHKVLHYFLYSKHDGRFENTGSSYEPFMLLKRGAGKSGFDIVILETTGNTKTIYHNGGKSLMDFTYTNSYTYHPTQSHYVTMKKEDFYKEMLIEIKYMEADYDSWLNQETQYAYINEYYLYNSADGIFGKDPRLDVNAELHPEKNWKYKEYFKNREIELYPEEEEEIEKFEEEVEEEIEKFEEEINNIEKSHLIEEPNNNSYWEEPLEDFEQKDEPEEDDEAPKDEEPEKNKEEILFDKISSLKNKGYNFKKIGIELSITKKEAKAIYKKYN